MTTKDFIEQVGGDYAEKIKALRADNQHKDERIKKQRRQINEMRDSLTKKNRQLKVARGALGAIVWEHRNHVPSERMMCELAKQALSEMESE